MLNRNLTVATRLRDHILLAMNKARAEAEQDYAYWERLATGQDTEEAEESGRLEGVADGLELAVTFLDQYEKETNRPVVLITRHPDAADWLVVEPEGSVDICYLDLGSSFDVTKLGPEDEEAVKDTITGCLADIAHLPTNHPAKLARLSELEELWGQLSESTRSIAEIEARWKERNG